MPQKAGDVWHNTFLCQHGDVIGKRLEPPIDAGAQRIQRHAFDLGQVFHHQVTILFAAGRDGEAAVAHDDGRYTQRWRRADGSIPSDLRIKMRVRIDDARHQREAICINNLGAIGREIFADRADRTVFDQDVGFYRIGAGTVINVGARDQRSHGVLRALIFRKITEHPSRGHAFQVRFSAFGGRWRRPLGSSAKM